MRWRPVLAQLIHAFGPEQMFFGAAGLAGAGALAAAWSFHRQSLSAAPAAG